MGFVVFLSFLCCLAITPAVKHLAWKLDAVSRPDGKRRTQSQATPVLGGVAISMGVLAGTLVAMLFMPEVVSYTKWLAGLGLTTALLCLLGAYDDCHEIRALPKLAGQVVAIVPLLAVGCYAKTLVIFGYPISLGYLAIPCSLAWFVLVINAVNLIDGMDGLASLVCTAAALGVALIALSQGRAEILVVALTLAAALMAFLFYNRPPAQIYLGDCGSMALGGILAALTLSAAPQPGEVHGTVVVLLLFLPLCDTILAITRRHLNGTGIMVADRGHVHHRLLEQGFRVPQALAMLGTIGLASALLAWAVSRGVGEWLALGMTVSGVALAVRFQILGHHEWALLRQRLLSSGPSEPAEPSTLPVSEHGEPETRESYRDAA